MNVILEGLKKTSISGKKHEDKLQYLCYSVAAREKVEMDIPKYREQLVAEYKAGRRDFSRIELSHVDLSTVDLSAVNFSGSDLTNVNFSAATLAKANFRGAYLDRAILTKSNLSEANLQGAELGQASIEDSNLAGANFSRSNLTGAKLMASTLSSTDLGQASLEGANLERADLSNANVEQTNLKNANLKSANLTGVNLEQALLEDALYNTETQFPDRFNPLQAGMQLADARWEKAESAIEQYKDGKRDFSRIDLSKLRMCQADFSEANLTAADLSQADFSAANLSKTTLRGAILNDSKLKQANLTQADMRGAYLENCQLIKAILVGVNLGRADLSAANLSSAQMLQANVEQASLVGAVLTEADLSKANLVQANLEKANLEKANLSGSNLSGTNLTQTNLQAATYTSDTQFPKDFEPAAQGMIAIERNLSQPVISGVTNATASNANGHNSNGAKVKLPKTNINKSNLSTTPNSSGNNPAANVFLTSSTKSAASSNPLYTPLEDFDSSSPPLQTQFQPTSKSERAIPPASDGNDPTDPSILNLAIRLDTSKLRTVLARELWEDASVETIKLLLVSCRQPTASLDPEVIATIPTEIIQAIDTLWSDASNGRYGFKAQVSLLEDLRSHNPFDGFEEIYKLFLERVRWKVVHYRSSYVVKVERGDSQVKGQFPVYLKSFLNKKTLGLSYVINRDGLNCFWTHLRDCLSKSNDVI